MKNDSAPVAPSFWWCLHERFSIIRPAEYFSVRLGVNYKNTKRFLEEARELSFYVANPHSNVGEFSIVTDFDSNLRVDFTELSEYEDEDGDLPPCIEKLAARIFTEQELAGYSLNQKKILTEVCTLLSIEEDFKKLLHNFLRLGYLNGNAVYLYLGPVSSFERILEDCHDKLANRNFVVLVISNEQQPYSCLSKNILLCHIDDCVKVTQKHFSLTRNLDDFPDNLLALPSEQTDPQQKAKIPFTLLKILDDGIVVEFKNKRKTFRPPKFGKQLAALCKNNLQEIVVPTYFTRDDLKNNEFYNTFFSASTATTSKGSRYFLKWKIK